MTKIGPLISTSLKSLQTPSVSRTDEILALRICSFYLRLLSPFPPALRITTFCLFDINEYAYLFRFSRERAVEKDRSLASRRFDLNERTASGVVRAKRRRRRSAVAQCLLAKYRRSRNSRPKTFSPTSTTPEKSSRSLDFRKTYRKRDTPRHLPALPPSQPSAPAILTLSLMNAFPPFLNYAFKNVVIYIHVTIFVNNRYTYINIIIYI